MAMQPAGNNAALARFGMICGEANMSIRDEGNTMHVETILADLVAIPDLPGQSNAAMSACVQRHLASAGAKVTVMRGPEGDRDNIFATLGPADQAGYVLSGHMDVVPVAGQDWTSDPFELTARDGRLYGRGTSDMKGFLACMLATAYAHQDTPLTKPLHLAFSYDEEIGCRGVGHMIARLPNLCAAPLGCIIGEPSDMTPVLSHKGKHAVVLRLTGASSHSSTPDEGLNAIYPAAELALFVRDLNDELAQNGPFDAGFEPPHSTVVAGMIDGGTAVNIIPDACSVWVECRAVPGQNPIEMIDRIIAFARDQVSRGLALSLEVETLGMYPALPPPSEVALSQTLARLSGRATIPAVSYGTEAGLFYAAGFPAIICGPGSMSRAHKPDEFVEPSELADCCRMLDQLVATVLAR